MPGNCSGGSSSFVSFSRESPGSPVNQACVRWAWPPNMHGGNTWNHPSCFDDTPHRNASLTRKRGRNEETGIPANLPSHGNASTSCVSVAYTSTWLQHFAILCARYTVHRNSVAIFPPPKNSDWKSPKPILYQKFLLNFYFWWSFRG